MSNNYLYGKMNIILHIYIQGLSLPSTYYEENIAWKPLVKHL